MRNFLIGFILFFTCVGTTTAQESYKFRLLLTDKAGCEYSVERPEEFLSERALARRAKYHIPIDETDLPVSKTYLNLLQQQPGITVVSQSKWLNSVVISCNDSLAGVHLKNLPFVDSVKPVWKGNDALRRQKSNDASYSGIKCVNNATSINFTNEDDYYGRAETQIKMHNGELLHQAGYKGAGIVIAVIDAGFKNANNIPGLNQSIIGNKDFVVPGRDVYAHDMSEHGTMVLSTMGANIPGSMVGTAPDASYWLLRSEDVASEYPVEEDYWAAAAEFADSVGVDVINTSLGYSRFDYPATNYTKEQLDGKTAFISQAANKAAQKGIFSCVSAGNSGNDDWRLINCPGDAKEVLTVGSVNDKGVIASSSSVGPTADRRIKPNVTAMGVSACVLNPSGNVTFSSGTSFASPIMAGLAACLLQAFPNYTHTDIIDLLENSASQSDMPDYDYGYGIPNVYKAYLTGISGIKQTADKSMPTLFVNPFGMLYIYNLPASSEKYTVTFHNACGELLCQKIPAGNSIDISSLQRGIYFVSVQGGGIAYTSKIVI